MSQARERLKEAVAAFAAITEQIATLETASASATRIIENAQAALEGFSGLDNDITAYRIGAVKSGLGTQPLPDSLKEKMTAKRNAEEELEQAKSTLEAITAELSGVRKELTWKELPRMKAATSVLHELADKAATELIVINRRQWELQWILTGLWHLKVPTESGIQKLAGSPLMDQAFSFHQPAFEGIFDPLAGMSSRWQDRLNVLLANPDADISLPKPVMPQDWGPIQNFGPAQTIVFAPARKLLPEAD